MLRAARQQEVLGTQKQCSLVSGAGGGRCGNEPGHPGHARKAVPTSLTVGAAAGPRSPGRCPLKVSLDVGSGQPPVPLQGVQDIADRIHQVSHVALALREKLWGTEVGGALGGWSSGWVEFRVGGALGGWSSWWVEHWVGGVPGRWGSWWVGPQVGGALGGWSPG